MRDDDETRDRAIARLEVIDRSTARRVRSSDERGRGDGRGDVCARVLWGDGLAQRGKEQDADGGPYVDLNEPHAFEPLLGKTWTCVGGGAAATHAAAIDDEGRFVQKTGTESRAGQLGHGDYKNRGTPTLVEALRDEKCVAVACGKSHTAVVCENGDVYGIGSNKFGQIGSRTMKKQMKRAIPRTTS